MIIETTYIHSRVLDVVKNNTISRKQKQINLVDLTTKEIMLWYDERFKNRKRLHKLNAKLDAIQEHNNMYYNHKLFQK